MGDVMRGTSWETPGDRDLRRWILTRRLLLHRARTHTIYEFTGITRHRLAHLRQRWQIEDHERLRGPSPSSLAVFFQSAEVREVASCAAVVGMQFELARCIPIGTDHRPGQDLEFGERACEAYEMLSICCPAHGLELEQFLLLASALSRDDSIALGRCTNCGCALILDLLGAQEPICQHCRASPIRQEFGTHSSGGLCNCGSELCNEQLALF
jgi:hypothetical protein